MSEEKKNMIDYFVICVNIFAEKNNMPVKAALDYLNEFRGLDYLEEFYDVEHMMSFDDTMEHLALVCSNNGGNLA